VSEMKTTSLAAFASQLRAWRQQLNWTQVEAADKLGYSASLVSGIETMDKTPTADFASRCDTVFGAPGTFATMRDLVAREVWPSYFAPVIELETSAIRIHEWEMRVVPGLLQTEEYARGHRRGQAAGRQRRDRPCGQRPAGTPGDPGSREPAHAVAPPARGRAPVRGGQARDHASVCLRT
jgi:transcriptional regulator with XRE-family HTH domain